MNLPDIASVARIRRHKPDRPTLVWQLTDRGFGSEILHLLLGALYSLEEDYNFLLYSRTWNVSTQFGWRDYFVDFCDQVDHPALRYACIFRKPKFYWRLAFAARRLVLSRVLPVPLIFTNEVWQNVRHNAFMRRTFAAGTEQETDIFDASRRLLLAIWQHNAATAQEIDRIQSRVMGDKNPYCTIHIRRGDKKGEAPYVAIEKYIAQVQAVNPKMKRIFVMTDDYDAFQEIETRYPQLDFVTLCPQNRRGHLQKRFNRIARARRREETLLLLTEIEIARRGEFFVGTYSSNLGKLVALLRGKETTYSLDWPDPFYYSPRTRTKPTR